MERPFVLSVVADRAFIVGELKTEVNQQLAVAVSIELESNRRRHDRKPDY
jgi:hypothetical protein